MNILKYFHDGAQPEKARARRLSLMASLIAIGAVGGIFGGVEVLHSRGNASADKASRRLYDAARSDDYREAPATPEVVRQLRKWEEKDGKVKSYGVRMTLTQALGRPSLSILRVQRGKKTFEETCSMGDSQTIYAVYRENEE